MQVEQPAECEIKIHRRWSTKVGQKAQQEKEEWNVEICIYSLICVRFLTRLHIGTLPPPHPWLARWSHCGSHGRVRAKHWTPSDPNKQIYFGFIRPRIVLPIFIRFFILFVGTFCFLANCEVFFISWMLSGDDPIQGPSHFPVGHCNNYHIFPVISMNSPVLKCTDAE